MCPFGKERYTQLDLSIFICLSYRCKNPITFTVVEFKPIIIRHSGCFPPSGYISKDIYNITIVLELGHLDFRFTHPKHILPIVYHVLYLVTIIRYQAHFQVRQHRVGLQCFLITFITDPRNFRYINHIFVVPQQRQILHCFPYTSDFGKVHPIESSGYISNSLSTNYQTNSILTRSISVFICTTGIYRCRSFESINISFIRCIAIYRMPIRNIYPHLLFIIARDIRTGRREINLSIGIPYGSYISSIIIVNQICYIYCEIRCRINNVDTR